MTTIFYFSGTGNALSVANWIKRTGEKYVQDVQLINIGKLENRRNVKLNPNTNIGLISPTHGFNFPSIMFHFILRLPRSNGNSVFIVNTRAGMKMGKYFLPGLSGLAQFLSAIILLMKGYRIIGMHPIDLPSNWISIHPGIRLPVVQSIYHRRQKETERFAERIFSGKKDLLALRDLIQDLLIAPIGVLYYFIGRFYLAKSFIATSECDRCDRCVKECPVQAIKIVNDRPFWTYNCESCMQCMNRCPQRAIETAHGFLTGITVFVYSFLIYKIYSWTGINSIYQYLPEFLRGTGAMIIESVILLTCLILGYGMAHYLMRFRAFERLMKYTSLTTFRFWRRYSLRKYKFWKTYRFKKT